MPDIPSNIDDLLDLIAQEIIDNNSGLIEEHTLRYVLNQLVKILDTKVSLISPTLTAEQLEIWKKLADFKASDSLGVITTGTVFPDAKCWGFAAPGTYPNANNLVIDANNIGVITFDGTDTYSRVQLPIPQATQFIPSFTGSTFPIAGPAQRIYNDTIWEIASGVSAVSTDVPGVSSKWNKKVGGKDLATDDEFKAKTESKAMSSKQLFDNVIGDFNFPNDIVPLEMIKPESTFLISKANQFLPSTIYWSPADNLYSEMQYITSIDLFFREISASFNVYIFARNNSSAPVQTISVSPPSSVGQKTHVFATPVNNATHKIYVGNGMSFYAFTGANATEYINAGATGINPNVILGVKLNGYKIDGVGSKKIVERLNALDQAFAGSDVIKVYKGSTVFPTISSAVNSIKTLTGKKTIHVYPGVYEEMVDLYAINQNLTVEIIGIGTGVKILKRTGDYYAPPMQVNCNSYFENITFESTSELGLQNPGSYAVHSDINVNQTANPNYPCTIEFYRCKFSNTVVTNQAFGAGSWQGARLIFKNCLFEKKNTLANGGSMYWHNAVANNVTGQRLEMHFCEVYSDGGPSLQLHDANQTVSGNTNPALSEAKVLFIGNTFYSGNTAVNSSVRLQENVRQTGALVGNIFLDPRSHGNNITILNA